MDRTFKIGCYVYFFDSHRVGHAALVTNWFHGGPDGETLEQYEARKKAEGTTSPLWTPSCNVVFVAEDRQKQDPYGVQIERQTSCAYGRNQSTPFLGMCWAWPDEVEEAKQLAAKAYAEAVAR